MLTSGTKFGPYEIQSPLGAGGMGEVYRARDTRLDRTVAIKILPTHLSDNPEAKQRFDREARAISSLNHPNVCTLYDVGHQDGTDYLVMEFMEGETLADRLLKGPMPLEQVLKFGIEICEGLARAHRSGVIHRDLKPGNIMLTRSGAKLMDFGLAKPSSAAQPPSSGLTQTLASASHPLTAQGMIVGTFQYMSPEQVEGKDADARSDIFALGAVLYEMLSGKRAFQGKTTASTIAAILAAEPPPISTIQPMTPEALDYVVRTCLAKDPDQRWQSCADVGRQLAWALHGRQQPAVSVAAVRGGRKILWAVLAVLLSAAAFLLGARWHTATPDVVQFEVNPPDNTYFNFRGISGPPVASPDGTLLAFVAFSQGQVGVRSLWLRSLGSSESRILPGTESAAYPFWSPDGKFLAFFASGKLKKFDVLGGNALPICDVAEGRGGTWSTDGLILFGTRADSLFRVPAAGGKPVRLTTLDEARQETSHRWPQFLPDQKHFLFVAQAPQVPPSRLFVASLDAPKGKQIEDIISNANFSEGYLAYMQENSLFARPFDTGRLEFNGEPLILAEHVQSDAQFNYSTFSLSSSVLSYQTGAVVAGTRLTVFDRSGKPTVLSQEAGLLQNISLSPSGDQLTMSLGISSGQLDDVWTYDLRKNTRTKITFDQRSYSPVWSPDGTRVAFDRVVADGDEVVIKDVSGRGAEQIVLKVSSQNSPGRGGAGTPQSIYPLAWSADGRCLLYRSGRKDIRVLSLTGEHKSVPLLTTNMAWTGAALSPDGKWLVYVSDESGLPEIYVVPFHSAADPPNIEGGKWQVSNGGGSTPQWRPDGKELFFSNSSLSTLMSAQVNTSGDRFEYEKPQYVFDLDAHPVGSYYAVTRDGQKIFMTTYGPGSTAPITVTLHWKELLKK